MKGLDYCIFPVAGLGTRFLPATKETPKEMLPLIDRPIIHYGVEEAAASGCKNIVFVTGRGKRSIEDYFDRSHDLESMLEERGKGHLADMVRSISTMARFSYVRQTEPLGLGHAVMCARASCHSDYVGIILPDDVIISSIPDLPVLAQLNRISQKYKASVLALEEVDEEDTGRYGIVKAVPTDERGVYAIKGMVEKPARGTAPSNLAIIGRYVLSGKIFDYIERLGPGAGGEYQLTDAIEAMLQDEPVYGFVYAGHRMDCGTKEGWLRATIKMALKDKDLKNLVMEVIGEVMEYNIR